MAENLLLAAGILSALITLLHIVLVFRPEIYRQFGADELADMHEQGSPFTVLVTIGLALVFAVWALYGFAGAGLIRALPWMRVILFSAAAIYVLRGLMLLTDLVQLLRGGYPFRFVLFSSISLSTGLLYLLGTLRL